MGQRRSQRLVGVDALPAKDRLKTSEINIGRPVLTSRSRFRTAKVERDRTNSILLGQG